MILLSLILILSLNPQKGDWRVRWLNFQCESRVGQDTLISVILPQGLLLERACRRFSKGFLWTIFKIHVSVCSGDACHSWGKSESSVETLKVNVLIRKIGSSFNELISASEILFTSNAIESFSLSVKSSSSTFSSE